MEISRAGSCWMVDKKAAVALIGWAPTISTKLRYVSTIRLQCCFGPELFVITVLRGRGGVSKKPKERQDSFLPTSTCTGACRVDATLPASGVCFCVFSMYLALACRSHLRQSRTVEALGHRSPFSPVLALCACRRYSQSKSVGTAPGLAS